MATADNKLIHELIKRSQKNSKLIRHTDYVAPNVPMMTIRSWKMNEYKYKVVPSPFPTLARGLFTTEVDQGRRSSGKAKEYRIVVRGYDKFFNIGEVPWTRWDSLEAHTGPPYTLSLKSNGCIIFIAALNETKLVVTSKHSVGPVGNAPRSHSQVGEEWLHKHLEKVGKTTEELAKTLWKAEWTAIAELCDDDFEEHVLSYPPEKSGLHLHGLNENTEGFRTKPTGVVDKFADEWGFIKTKTTVLNSIQEVRKFTDDVALTGKWEGEALEGFVVRTQVVDPPDGAKSNIPPYSPGSSFFFKVKFDEPYLMYRDWREVTKILLSHKGPSDGVRLPPAKMRRPETKRYVQWVKAEIRRDRSQFQNFTKGKGIIATRERFLAWIETKGAREASVDEDVPASKSTFGKTIILPVGIPGVGKTSISVALEHLFHFGHTQSDDVKGKRPASNFIKNVKNLLGEDDVDVVIADKNNHKGEHRKALREAVRGCDPPVRLLALNWAFDKSSPATIHKICSARIYDRGGNHQTLQADVHKNYENVICDFIEKSEVLEAGEADAVIEMDINEDLEHALDRAVDGCVRILGLEKPDQEKVGLALAAARGYTPAGVGKREKQKKGKRPRYYGIVPNVDLLELLDPFFSEGGDAVVVDGREFFTELKNTGRITEKPHITIVHKNSLHSESAHQLWARCSKLHPSSTIFTFHLGSVIWNDRVMAIVIDGVLPVDDGDEEGRSFVNQLPQEVLTKLHITVGTARGDIRPFEARALVEDWRRDGKSVKCLELANQPSRGPIEGLFS